MYVAFICIHRHIAFIFYAGKMTRNTYKWKQANWKNIFQMTSSSIIRWGVTVYWEEQYINEYNLLNEKEKGQRVCELWYINSFNDASLVQKKTFSYNVTHRNTLGIEHRLIICNMSRKPFFVTTANDIAVVSYDKQWN